MIDINTAAMLVSCLSSNTSFSLCGNCQHESDDDSMSEQHNQFFLSVITINVNTMMISCLNSTARFSQCNYFQHKQDDGTKSK